MFDGMQESATRILMVDDEPAIRKLMALVLIARTRGQGLVRP
jgi:CheY-like chemotaxis protein